MRKFETDLSCVAITSGETTSVGFELVGLPRNTPRGQAGNFVLPQPAWAMITVRIKNVCSRTDPCLHCGCDKVLRGWRLDAEVHLLVGRGSDGILQHLETVLQVLPATTFAVGCCRHEQEKSLSLLRRARQALRKLAESQDFEGYDVDTALRAAHVMHIDHSYLLGDDPYQDRPPVRLGLCW